MRNLYIIFLLFLTASCTSNNEQGIEKVKQEAIDAIIKTKDEAIKDANKQIEAKTADRMIAANDSIAIIIQKAQENLSNKVSDRISSELKEIENMIKSALLLGGIGILIGCIGCIIAVNARKRTKYRSEHIIRVLRDAIYHDEDICNRIKMTIVQNSQTYTYSKNEIDRLIRNCSLTKEERRLLAELSNASNKSRANGAKNTTCIVSESVQESSQHNSVVLYARESNTNQLSTVETSFQRGKSLYKLVLDNKDERKARISLCIDQEEAKLRILNTDTQYLEPICIVQNQVNTPREVVVKKTGIAEKREGGWYVIEPITVEFK